MIEAMKEYAGKALTVTGPVAPEALGQVMMHEHLHCDLHDPDTDRLVVAETPTPPEREKTDGRFGPCSYIPPPPFLHMFTHTLPALRKLGLTAEEEDWIMRKNPQRLIPVG